MPASTDTTKRATVDIGEGHQVTVTVPHIEGSGTAHTVFKGSKKPYQKECVLIVDHITGEITLEKLAYNVQLKDTRGAFKSEGRRSNTPVENGFSGKKSPMSFNNKLSPQQKPHSTSFERSSPVQKCSPLPKSPPINNLPSPSNHSSHSMPSLNNLTSKPAVVTETPTFHLPGEEIDAPPVGVLSSSSSSGSSSSEESSDSSSSDNEEVPAAPAPPKPQPLAVSNGFHQSPKKKEMPNPFSSNNNLSMPTASSLPSMPKFSLLSEDLQLSESDSDSD
ncbi:ELL-associated factor 2 like protein [Argiope bruennichi]|uniref:Ell-associated factor Eaf n=2 Tax=Argiope bruennichi TaxID=94029 RepID=A0A8T0G6L9_ARGBR|nr:ELL-associated factor 2 like protein [Argiope bruennichi]